MKPSVSLRPVLVLFGGILLQFTACRKATPEPDGPTVMDNTLRLELIESDPQIMTPIGMAIDSADQLYILESHTHSPMSDYSGPKFDRIKKGIDQDGDGKPDSWLVFADGISDGMNLDCGPDNIIYLAAKDRVVAFRDLDQDGISDHTDTILLLHTTTDVYDHAGILGVALSPDGWLFISRGNTGGLAWEMEGSDGSRISGYGDGGNLVRCRPDGSELVEIATGFWNPFDLKFTRTGRLLLTDNDPDSRGPNRMVEIVDGGDYGYKSIYGGSGIHPFLSWNGELPGTLPYAAALGEAPTGMIDAAFTNFGESYQGNMLVGVWEENSLVRIPLHPWESSLRGTAEVLVKGDSTFHPVALAVNSKGDLYITDWVVRQYPNHGKGRIWRLSSGTNQPMARRTIASIPGPEKGGKFVSRYLQEPDRASLLAAFLAGDAFTRSVARKYWAKAGSQQETQQLLQDEDATIRLQALLSLFHSEWPAPGALLRELLADESEDIRRMTLIYIALHSRSDLYQEVVQSLYQHRISPDLFPTYLAAVRQLQPNFIDQYTHQRERPAKQVELTLPPDFLLSLVRDPALPAEIRAAALPLLEPKDADSAVLIDLLKSGEAPIQSALLELFSQRPEAGTAETMLQIAGDRSAPSELSARALVSLSYQSGNYCEEMVKMLSDQRAGVAQVALRYLCRCREEPEVQASVSQFLQSSDALVAGPARQIWELCRGNVEPSRPETKTDWVAIIDGKGDELKGKWVFHSRQAQCQSCHRIQGWGGDFGPDLSHISSSKSKEQLLTAILEPSKEISPEWQGWYVTDREGKTHFGRQIDVGSNNVELLMASGEFVSYKEPQSYGMATTSLMPDGVESALTVGEVNDLITYLMSLK